MTRAVEPLDDVVLAHDLGLAGGQLGQALADLSDERGSADERRGVGSAGLLLGADVLDEGARDGCGTAGVNKAQGRVRRGRVERGGGQARLVCDRPSQHGCSQSGGDVRGDLSRVADFYVDARVEAVGLTRGFEQCSKPRS
ncbi:hypothetical protein GCM10025862_37910 [Arsenicicoccus piscis]|uniref:Uncharacterized protein n=1 Tax=Arsenicicoccus piscis TaxID=673954 RepID=A0ABQ6HTZ3_9MICO|nr:hypothetical protein GCM10025862_37910 [Arsenicicoccus piscis]